jgi:hypothetical protein
MHKGASPFFKHGFGDAFAVQQIGGTTIAFKLMMRDDSAAPHLLLLDLNALNA